HHYNTVVHQHSQTHDKSEKDHGVHGIAQCVQDHQGHEHGHGDGKPDKKGDVEPKEEHQHGHHEDDPKDDVVHQIINLTYGHGGLVVGNSHFAVLREGIFDSIINDHPNLVRSIDHVLARRFFDVQHHYGVTKFPCLAGLVL